MAEKKPTGKGTKTAAKRTGASNKSFKGLTADERAAMKERVAELKAEARADKTRAEGERDVRAKIAEMPTSDRVMAERIHAIVGTNAPNLMPRTWYGMPAYTKDGNVVCFFKAASKFDSRYATFGCEEAAKIDEGAMWPTSWALTKLTAAEEKKIGAIVKRAAS